MHWMANGWEDREHRIMGCQAKFLLPRSSVKGPSLYQCLGEGELLALLFPSVYQASVASASPFPEG
eukprot:6214057-Karenia_brevis.AAC.1